MTCFQCSKSLDSYDLGLYRKLIDKSAAECLCRQCLGRKIGWSQSYLDSLISLYQDQGCTMFPPKEG